MYGDSALTLPYYSPSTYFLFWVDMEHFGHGNTGELFSISKTHCFYLAVVVFKHCGWVELHESLLLPKHYCFYVEVAVLKDVGWVDHYSYAEVEVLEHGLWVDQLLAKYAMKLNLLLRPPLYQ